MIFQSLMPHTIVLQPITRTQWNNNMAQKLLFGRNYGAEMDSTQYENIVRYLRDGEYPTGLSKQEKSVLRRCIKNCTFNAESTNAFYIDKGENGSTFMRLVIKGEEKLRVFQECHCFCGDFGGHAGRDNTIQKIKDRYCWPQYYKRVSMGLTDRRKPAKNLVDSRKN